MSSLKYLFPQQLSLTGICGLAAVVSQ